MTDQVTVNNPQRGEIWRILFDPEKGQEIKEVRPAVVVNPNSMGLLRLKIVVPLQGGSVDIQKSYGWFPSNKARQPA